eukprot:4583594-Alexandrium_andersonii.AAC.1
MGWCIPSGAQERSHSARSSSVPRVILEKAWSGHHHAQDETQSFGVRRRSAALVPLDPQTGVCRAGPALANAKT